MNWYFLFIQLLDLVAWIILAVSYYRKDTDKILVFQILATILYCLHYYLLGAYSGMFICVFEVIRDILYYKTSLDKYIFIGSIPIYFVLGLIGYDNIYSFLVITASIIDGYALTCKKNIVLIGAIISYCLWFIYDISVRSYVGAITDGLIILSNLLILLFGKNVLDKFKLGLNGRGLSNKNI